MHGGLKDEDRIFTNLYCQGDPFIKVLTAAAQLSCSVGVPLTSFSAAVLFSCPAER